MREELGVKDENLNGFLLIDYILKVGVAVDFLSTKDIHKTSCLQIDSIILNINIIIS